MLHRHFLLTGFALTVFLPAAVPADSNSDQSPQLSVDTDFEGASARVLDVDHQKNRIRIVPGGEPERGWPAWWCCRVLGLQPNQPLTITVEAAPGALPAGRPGAGKPLSASWAMPARAAWSVDGKHWQHTAEGQREDRQITYQVTANQTALWIAWGPLATPQTVRQWVDEALTTSDFVRPFELAQSRAGLTVRGVRIADGESQQASRPVVWFQARQHAWESGSSWVAKGIMDWLTGDTEDAVWLRQHAEIYVVPIMDVDRTATGDGGKESVPHDHNRDWSDKPHYPEVAAAQQHVRRWVKQDRMSVFVDLHNPGASEKDAYFFVAPDEVMTPSSKARRAAGNCADRRPQS